MFLRSSSSTEQISNSSTMLYPPVRGETIQDNLYCIIVYLHYTPIVSLTRAIQYYILKVVQNVTLMNIKTIISLSFSGKAATNCPS